MKFKIKKIELFTNWQIIILATVVFVVILIFFDSNNLIMKSELNDKIAGLRHERDSLKEQIAQDSIIIDGIEHDNKFLERYARENFYMLRDNEELFIVEQDKE